MTSLPLAGREDNQDTRPGVAMTKPCGMSGLPSEWRCSQVLGMSHSCHKPTRTTYGGAVSQFQYSPPIGLA